MVKKYNGLLLQLLKVPNGWLAKICHALQQMYAARPVLATLTAHFLLLPEYLDATDQ